MPAFVIDCVRPSKAELSGKLLLQMAPAADFDIGIPVP